MNTIFYTCRNVTGMFSAGLLCNIKILESLSSNIDFLTSHKTDKGKQYIEHSIGLNINDSLNLYSEWYINHGMHLNNWMDVYDQIDVSPLKKYDSLHIFGGLHFPQSNLTRFSKRCNIFPNDRGQLKFRQTGIHIVNIMAIHKAHVVYNIPLHEFSYDSDELCSGMFNVPQNNSKYYLYHIYDMPRYGMDRIDSLQYYFSYPNKNEYLSPTEKLYDLTFGYTIFPYGNRPHYETYVNTIASKFDCVNIYVKNTVTGENNSIDRDQYLEKISKSKYTLILPSYDNSCFSLYRFIESIYNDCLPLIHRDCTITEVEKSYNVDLSQLITDECFSEKRRMELLTYYKNKFLSYEKGFIDAKS